MINLLMFFLPDLIPRTYAAIAEIIPIIDMIICVSMFTFLMGCDI